MSDDIDWSKAPEGATHWTPAKDAVNPFLRKDGAEWFWFDGREWTAYVEDGPQYAHHIAKAVPRPTLQPKDHPDNLALIGFANAMRDRLAQCRAAGRSGWDDPEQCPPQRLAEGLVRAVRAGKLVDVGNYAMMLWYRTNGRGLPPGGVARWIGDLCVQRREPIEWNGTGLPPVGTECEFNAKYRGWVAVTIVAHVTKRSGTPSVLFDTGEDWHWESNPKRLRPILTPEQRAAKERDEAVEAMLAVPEVFHDAQTMQALYDAGYRKTEGE